MVSFNSMNFDNVGIPKVNTNPSGVVVDMYDKFQEKKDNLIAVTVANNSNTKERIGATTIGAIWGLLQVAALGGVYALAKTFPKLNHPLVDKYVTQKFDKWINRAIVNYPQKTKAQQLFIGLYAKTLYAMTIGAIIGYGFDWFKTARNTIIDGKISNTKSGVEGSWITSGLKSLSATDEGKQIIKNSIIKNNDKSITVRFVGVDKEYTIGKKELKNASRAYVTYMNDDGKVTGFKKKFSKGDGDALAFEIAFEKYCKDVNSGNVQNDDNLPATHELSDNGDILFTNGSVNQLYYLLTGKKSINADIENPNNDNIDDIYSKSSINKFVNDISQNPDKYSAEIKLKDSQSGKMILGDKYYVLQDLKTDKNYTVTKMDSKYITLANSEKTKETVTVPVEKLKNHIASVSYVNLKD